jgi:acetyl-CoA carboxylase biotin carboxyl carrier protein
MDIKDIQNLVRFVAKAGVSEVKYKNKDFEIYIKTPLGGEPVSYVTPQVAYQAPVSAPVANPDLLLQLLKQQALLMTANILPSSLQ